MTLGYYFRNLIYYIYIGQAVAIQQSQAEKNRAAAAAKYKKQMIKEQQRMYIIFKSFKDIF